MREMRAALGDNDRELIQPRLPAAAISSKPRPCTAKLSQPRTWQKGPRGFRHGWVRLITPLHWAIVILCALGLTFDVIEAALGYALSAAFSSPHT
jgi:hypothetical protein